MKKLSAFTECLLPFFTNSAQSSCGVLPPDTSLGGGAVGRPQPGDPMVMGKSVKKNILGKDVYNDDHEKIGDIRDVIINADHKAISYVIGVGGFLGMGEHDVEIPCEEVRPMEDHFMMGRYTKEQLKNLPEVKL